MFLCVASTCIAASQHPYKPEESQPDNFLGTKLRSSHQNMIHHLRHNDKSLFTEELVQGDPWTSVPKEMNERGSLANAQAQAHTRSHCEGADFSRRRRHRCLRFCVLQINGQRSQLDSMRSQLLWDISDKANAPRQAARAKENMENTIKELHTEPWHPEVLRECTQGSLIPLVQSAKYLNKLQRYLSGR